MAAALAVTVAEPHERPALENLMQFYVHDFSEHWTGGPQGELGDDGRFESYPLDAYWREADHIPLLIRLDGRLAGFALLDAVSHSGRPLDRNVAEFFIVRKHRRGGVGTRAVHQIFSRWPGRWEAAVARRNTAALPFWRKAAASHPLASEVEEIDVRSEAWDGPVIHFRIT